MRNLIAFVCIFVVAALFSCGGDNAVTHDFVETYTSYTATETEELKPVEYSPLAKEQFLEPLEDFSWEREFAPEYVMIHFTSDVVASREAPYNMDAVRNIFVNGGVSINYIIDREGEIYCYIP